MIERRALLRGLFAAPAIVAVSSLMPLRGIPLETLLSDEARINAQWEKAFGEMLQFAKVRLNNIMVEGQGFLLSVHDLKLPPIVNGDEIKLSYEVRLT